MPVIGITPCRQLPDYVESIRRAGGEPCVLVLNAAPSLKDLDGVLLTGGGDIAPSYYHEAPHPKANPPDPTRDSFELELAKLGIIRPSNRPLLDLTSARRRPTASSKPSNVPVRVSAWPCSGTRRTSGGLANFASCSKSSSAAAKNKPSPSLSQHRDAVSVPLCGDSCLFVEDDERFDVRRVREEIERLDVLQPVAFLNQPL
jgi:hypothetical protein